MQVVTDETMKKLIDGGESIAKVATGTTTELMNEAINLFIIESVLSILKFGVIFVIFFIVKKYLDAMKEAHKDKEGMFKSLNVTALIISLIFFTTQSYPHVLVISKALVAPKIFLMEKAASLVK